MILFIIASIVIVVAIPTTRENGVMAFSCRPSLAAALPRRRHSTPPPHYAASSASQQQQPLLDAILFDCDGVLADTERDGHRISFNMAFASFGIDEVWDEERYGKLLAVGGGKERMVAHWNEVGWPPQIPIDSNERLETIKQLHLKKTHIFMNLINDGSIPLRPGILRLVDEAIQNNVRLAVCSTSSVEAVTNLVRTLMGAQRASKFNIYAGDMVRRKKPSPDVYLMAINDMSLEKEKCIIIEDSHIGLHAAMAAGINCLVTKSSYTSNEDFTGAKCIINELDDSITLSTLSRLLLDKDDDDNVESSTSDQRLSIVPNKSTSSSSSAAAAAGITTATATATTTWDRVGHVETAGVSWTGARFGENNINRPSLYTASETYESTTRRRANIGVTMVSHVENGGASWTGARFGDDNINQPSIYTPSETYETRRGNIGVTMVSHVEKGGVSWTGARLGEESNVSVTDNKAYAYTPSETYEYKSKGKGPGTQWDTIAHVERSDDENFAWTGARFAIDDDKYDNSKGVGRYRQSAPTPSKWRE